MTQPSTTAGEPEPAPVEAPQSPLPRRRLLCGGAAAALLPLVQGCAGPALSGLRADERGDALFRVANRLSWGANDVEYERIRRLGRDAYIAEQLRATAGPLPVAAQAQIDAMSISTRSAQALWTEIEGARKAGEGLATEAQRKATQDAFQQALNRVARESAHRHLLRALYAPNQLLEQMQWFWFNHFNVHQYKSNLRVLLGDYEERAIRPHALGRFRDLLAAVTRHPAMLRYLDNEQNAANRINENLARELMELHTLGVDAGYTQRDVTELARVLTGHGVNFTDNAPKLKPEWQAHYLRDGVYEFNPARHDFGDKAWLGQTLKGQGRSELEQVFDVLATHKATARFVSTKIARHLLADDPPPHVVDAMVSAWQRSGGQIAQVLAALLHSPEFAAPPSAQVGKFKDPMHFVVSAVRACYVDRVVLNTMPMQNWLNRLGQGLYNRQTPDGYPSTAAAWSSSGQIATRLDVARAVGGGSAGLFKADDPMAPREQPAFPQLARPIYWQVLRPMLADATRQALDQAASPQDWSALYLSSPEFMYA